MNNVIKYNTYILNFIVVSVLIILILFLGYKIWKDILTLILKLNLDFSRIMIKKISVKFHLKTRVL